AVLLLDAYRNGGVFGIKQSEMPENIPPSGSTRGDERHLALLTLTVALDYVRDHDQLWESAHLTCLDDRTSYLFDPSEVASTPYLEIVRDLQLHRLSLRPNKDARIWQQISVTLDRHFNGRLINLIDAAERDALHLIDIVESKEYHPGFPSLKGPKISRLWVKIIDENFPGGLKRRELVDVPVDIHIAQATLQTGCIETQALGSITRKLRSAVQRVCRDASVGLGEGYYPLAIEEPLWVLSRKGCRNRFEWPCNHRSQCPVAEKCLSDRVWLGSSSASRVPRSISS
ncbi:MAG: hypothetical protein ACOX87_14095, partial [Chloroflexota bacterium]